MKMSNKTLVYLLEHPWLIVLQIIAGACIATGVWTGNRIFRHANKVLGTVSIPHTAHWMPWVGNAYTSWTERSLKTKSQETQSPVFATTIYGRDYIVLTKSDHIQSFLEAGTVRSKVPDATTVSRRFFSNPNVTTVKAARKQQMMQIYRDDEKKLDAVASLLENHAYNLISPAQSWVDQAQWERTSEAKVVESESTLTVSASLNVLIRDFSAHILLCPLLGRSFLEANPDFIGDMFRFGPSYKSFIRGIPYWVMPGLGPPAFAREKCLRALDGLVRAITAEQTGRSVAGLGDAVLYDVDEIHKSILYAVRHAREEDKEKPNIRTISSEVLEFVFEMTYYYVLETVWVIYNLLWWQAESASNTQWLLDEIIQFVEVVKPPPSGLPYEDPPQLKFKNLSKLRSDFRSKCPVISTVVGNAASLLKRPLAEFTILSNKVLELEATAKGLPKYKIEVKSGDRILSGLSYATPSDLELIGSDERKQNSEVEYEDRVWIILSVILSLYRFDYDLTGLPGYYDNGSTSGYSSIAEPARDMKARISRRMIA